MASANKILCPVCQRLIAVQASGRMARHGHTVTPGHRSGQQCPTSGWVSLTAAVQFALKDAHERLAALPEAQRPGTPWERPSKEYQDRIAVQTWIACLQRAMARCTPVAP